MKKIVLVFLLGNFSLFGADIPGIPNIPFLKDAKPGEIAKGFVSVRNAAEPITFANLWLDSDDQKKIYRWESASKQVTIQPSHEVNFYFLGPKGEPSQVDFNFFVGAGYIFDLINVPEPNYFQFHIPQLGFNDTVIIHVLDDGRMRLEVRTKTGASQDVGPTPPVRFADTL